MNRVRGAKQWIRDFIRLYWAPLTLFISACILRNHELTWLSYILLTLCAGLSFQLFTAHRKYSKLKGKNIKLRGVHEILKSEFNTKMELLRDQQFVADIQTPSLGGDLEDFLQAILPDISRHLEAYQLSLFLSDNHGKLYPKALYSCSEESETSIFFLDSVEVELQTATTQVFKLGEDGLAPANESSTTSKRILMPMELDTESIQIEGERPLRMKANLVLCHTKKTAAHACITIHATIDNAKAQGLFHTLVDTLDIDFANVDKVVESKKHTWEASSDEEGKKELVFTYPLHVPSDRREDISENTIGALKIWKKSGADDLHDTSEKARKSLEKSMEAAQLSIAQAIRKEQVYRKSITDQLTKLYTKRHFITVLTEALHSYKRYKQRGTLILVDIDLFKKFNDTYGHLTGDLVLAGVAKIMADCCRDTDIPFRYGGEEMAFYLPHTSSEEGFIFAERVRIAIEEAEFKAVDEAQSTVKVTISMGVAHFVASMEKIDDIIALADECLYVSKDEGRNKVTLAQQKE